MPKIGFVNMVRRCVNCGTSFSGSTAELMAFIPNINTAKPSKMLPTSLCLSFLDDIIKSSPIIARIGENDVGFSIWIKKLLLSIPERLKIHDVIVVPTLAPMIIPTAWDNFMIPEFTKPTTITVVAEDDWITAVTPAPSNTALIGFDVSFSRIFSSLPPETLVRPSPITFIPYKNRARPPINDKIANMSIKRFLLIFSQFTQYIY